MEEITVKLDKKIEDIDNVVYFLKIDTPNPEIFYKINELLKERIRKSKFVLITNNINLTILDKYKLMWLKEELDIELKRRGLI